MIHLRGTIAGVPVDLTIELNGAQVPDAQAPNWTFGPQPGRGPRAQTPELGGILTPTGIQERAREVRAWLDARLGQEVSFFGAVPGNPPIQGKIVSVREDENGISFVLANHYDHAMALVIPNEEIQFVTVRVRSLGTREWAIEDMELAKAFAGPGSLAPGSGSGPTPAGPAVHASPEAFAFHPTDEQAQGAADMTLAVPETLTRFLDAWPWLPPDGRPDEQAEDEGVGVGVGVADASRLSWLYYLVSDSATERWCLTHGGLLSAAALVYGPLDQSLDKIVSEELGPVPADYWKHAAKGKAAPVLADVFAAALSALGALPMVAIPTKYAFRGIRHEQP